ncbi:tetraprenyl-beta-curcumene synthase family protein [Alicyclobacillus tolerans]|uniref:tetraprenyl-beta-curcumene synthase family protein n=1 Tax=Alicyclobacillus tolerans TaxID=90970 RepID=UPI001F2E4F23|nr:tetraprenyl-beta-curcumene synthase family protein [Alicyclobacillus tolerans]MCF8566117.1 tetraprenyl-beta-curcumene synthase family protein [Alicyclobacillus tolerans]
MPIARQEIRHWTERAGRIPDPVLRKQALASLSNKRFHADGGSVYAASNPRYTRQLVRLIVALQTISDYLDNLCDRCQVLDRQDFHQLHHAMRDAIQPGAPLRPYYALRGNPDDGGYLASLVLTCQQELSHLPSYDAVQPQVAWFIERYCELQEIKHIEPHLRTEELKRWWEPYEQLYPDVKWWEFAAATGSTLGMFSLFLAATESPTTDEVAAITHAYFPSICGLHILLDYLIDLEEDQREGDFNFVRCYQTLDEAHRRIHGFAKLGWERASSLPYGGRIHKDVVKGLLGMYLSDSKVGEQKQVRPMRKILWEFGPTAWVFYGACQLYRIVR